MTGVSDPQRELGWNVRVLNAKRELARRGELTRRVSVRSQMHSRRTPFARAGAPRL